MYRGASGEYVSSSAAGIACRAFVPAALPPQPALVIDNGLHQRLDNALLALGRLDAISTLLPETHLFLYSYVRKEAVMSSQIEGTQSSLHDLMLYEMEAMPGVPIDDVQEVSCYVQALSLGIERIRDGYPITTRLLLELHRQLLTNGRGTRRAPGEFRRVQNWIGGHRPDVAMFVPPPPHQVEAVWADLERFINDQPQATAPLIKAALAHVQFETIHPFLDGNGRLGRLLIPLMLVQSGVLKEPLLYLSLYFKAHRQSYYEYLQRVREQGDWETWLGFFADAVCATATQAVETAQQLSALIKADRERCATLGRLAPSARQVIDALAAQPISNIPHIAPASGLTPATIGKALDALEGLGIVRELTGQKRNRVFAYLRYVEILNQEISEISM